jgi:hypothetical protein
VAVNGAAEGRPLSPIELMAHLLRRAGFGATRDALEAALAEGYEAMLEELLHPEHVPELEEDLTSQQTIRRIRNHEWGRKPGTHIGWRRGERVFYQPWHV